MKHLAIGLLVTTLATTPATANVADYCAAFARDMADMATASTGNEALWQQHIDDHTRACTTRFAPERIVTPRKPVKPVKLAAIKKPAANPAVRTAKPAPVAPPQKLAKLAPALTPGTPAWTDYCKKKYVSFNIATGTYTSLTGVERKCLVTAE